VNPSSFFDDVINVLVLVVGPIVVIVLKQSKNVFKMHKDKTSLFIVHLIQNGHSKCCTNHTSSNKQIQNINLFNNSLC